MARPTDPYRTLGLPRDATLEEVKRAYRRLAKANHPDAAGEAALPRFLAIQEAYDRIISGAPNGTGTTRRPAAPRQPWEAEPSRADATHRAYGGRSRRTRPSGGPRPRPEPGPPPPPPGGRRAPRAPNKATLGSTSYDGAEAEPFDPDWGGASWYGTTSGTYWTINPKEYADPRKHGPEYQARARRARDAREAVAGGAVGATTVEEPAGPQPPDSPDAPQAPPSSDPPPSATHTTTSWWDATTGPAPTSPPAGPVARSTEPDPPWAWLEGDRPGMVARSARATLGWIPLALGVGWLAGEVTGCGRFAADCSGSSGWLVLLLQVALLALLLAIPRLATIAAVAGIATLVVAAPAALVIGAATRGETAVVDATVGMAVLGGLLALAWLGGATVGIARAVRTRPGPVS